MIKNVLFQEYSELIVGKKTSLSLKFFNSNMPAIAEKNALSICKYAVEDFLRYEPEVALEKMNRRLIKIMKLDSVLKYIRFPPEFDPSTDFDYVLSRLYPDKIVLDKEDYVLRYYKRILDTGNQFAFGYFSGDDGREKLCICLRHVISKLTYHSIDELYAKFSGYKGDGIRQMLSTYRIAHPCYDLYDDRVSFLHDALPDEYKDDYLWHYYLYISKKRKLIRDKNSPFEKIGKPYVLKKLPEIEGKDADI